MDDTENTTENAASSEELEAVAGGVSEPEKPTEAANETNESAEAEATESASASSEAVTESAEVEPTPAAAEEDAAPEEDAAEEAPAEEEAAEEEEEKEEAAPVVARTGPLEEFVEEDEEIAMDWYILKVQSNRENTICDALRRRVSVAGLDEYFGEIMVPTEDIVEFKNSKKKVVKRKLYPGYIVAHMSINDDTWFLVRETPGIGDFTGSQGKPSPMLKHEVDRIVKSANPDEEDSEQVKTAIPFKLGDRVRIKEGTFENFEGDVDGIDEANGRVTVMISIFGRSTPAELEHWQIEAI